MAKRTKNNFMSEDRNEKIRAGEIELQITEEDLSLMNKTELIQVGALLGISLHHGMSKEDILRYMRKPTKEKNPVDYYRDIIKNFLEENWNKIKEQIGINCFGNCYKCSDMTTLSCYIINSEIFRKAERKENGKTKKRCN
jgi:hypothetical protein